MTSRVLTEVLPLNSLQAIHSLPCEGSDSVLLTLFLTARLDVTASYGTQVNSTVAMLLPTPSQSVMVAS